MATPSDDPTLLSPKQEPGGGTCAPPVGMALVPTAGAIGSMLVSDGFNWLNLPPGNVGAVLTMGDNGPFWANP